MREVWCTTEKNVMPSTKKKTERDLMGADKNGQYSVAQRALSWRAVLAGFNVVRQGGMQTLTKELNISIATQEVCARNERVEEFAW